MKKAIVLLSGGLDTATCLALVKAEGYQCYALSFDYGQKHLSELDAAKKLAQHFDVVEHKILILPKIQGSALTETTIQVPENIQSIGITNTYVPARNTIFLSYALAWAELLDANVIFYGANAPDSQGFPDCREAYIHAFESMANLATKKTIEGNSIRIMAPLVHLSKAEIITLGSKLGVDYAQTITCYQADSAGRACGQCDSCRTRREGFIAAGIEDPTVYVD
jgi:7-cyano-7-deazaguanine synthase